MLTLKKFVSLSDIKAKVKLLTISRSFYNSTMIYDRDPFPHFNDANTQEILKSITQFRFNKIFNKKSLIDDVVEYKFMTTVELEEKFKAIIDFAHMKLQMPPVVEVRDGSSTILSEDTYLNHFSEIKFIVSDVSYGLNQSTRKIIARQTDGSLELAPMNISKRMNQVYFPLTGRNIRRPFMFQSKYLEYCLNEKKYEFILDRLTVQYEPYEKEFHDISSKVYQHINNNSNFDYLRSTRHFGPMAFFLAWHNSIDDLLYDMIRRHFLKNCVELIALRYKLNNIQTDYKKILQQLDGIGKSSRLDIKYLRECFFLDRVAHDVKDNVNESLHCPEDTATDELCMEFIGHYINCHALKKNQLDLALQALKE